ncbi:MAG: M67 family metallopeptidase [Acidobacteriota bacterium]
MISNLSETVSGSSASPVTAVDAVTVPGLAASELWLTEAQRRDLAYLVEASYPFEACGLLVGTADAQRIDVRDVFHARNLNVERARDRFLLDPDDHMAADRSARARGLDIVGIWHSHPDHPARPSVTDLEAAWEGFSYLIISTTCCGASDFRSWRLQSGKFIEEAIRDSPASSSEAASSSEKPSSENRSSTELSEKQS